MNKQEFSFAAGTVMIAASIVFFLLPAFFSLDGFIPAMLSILSLFCGIFLFMSGITAKQKS